MPRVSKKEKQEPGIREAERRKKRRKKKKKECPKLGAGGETGRREETGVL